MYNDLIVRGGVDICRSVKISGNLCVDGALTVTGSIPISAQSYYNSSGTVVASGTTYTLAYTTSPTVNTDYSLITSENICIQTRGTLFQISYYIPISYTTTNTTSTIQARIQVSPTNGGVYGDVPGTSQDIIISEPIDVSGAKHPALLSSSLVVSTTNTSCFRVLISTVGANLVLNPNFSFSIVRLG